MSLIKYVDLILIIDIPILYKMRYNNNKKTIKGWTNINVRRIEWESCRATIIICQEVEERKKEEAEIRVFGRKPKKVRKETIDA